MERSADPSVVLMDELDQLLTAKQDVVYNFFNWPTMRDSQLFVIAVANRMDLPQHLAAKIKSRLGGWRLCPRECADAQACRHYSSSRTTGNRSSKSCSPGSSRTRTTRPSTRSCSLTQSPWPPRRWPGRTAMRGVCSMRAGACGK